MVSVYVTYQEQDVQRQRDEIISELENQLKANFSNLDFSSKKDVSRGLRLGSPVATQHVNKTIQRMQMLLILVGSQWSRSIPIDVMTAIETAQSHKAIIIPLLVEGDDRSLPPVPQELKDYPPFNIDKPDVKQDIELLIYRIKQILESPKPSALQQTFQSFANNLPPLIGLVFIVVGVWVLSMALNTNDNLIWFIGIFMLVAGILVIVKWLTNR
jgi:hypothetical protein